MDSHDENHPALVKLRAWESDNTPLELYFSAPKMDITIPVVVVGVSTSELRLNWSLLSPPALPFISAEGTAVLILDGASLLPNESSDAIAKSPSAPVHVWRDAHHRCIIRPINPHAGQTAVADAQ